eukprot:Pompholyxophrys_punicea_v1_NODE_68_length_3883_cov_3.555643.p1 type:complete len:166 gc:universal NODE_68_length_3883_cov_3.555643:3588-3091(-)
MPPRILRRRNDVGRQKSHGRGYRGQDDGPDRHSGVTILLELEDGEIRGTSELNIKRFDGVAKENSVGVFWTLFGSDEKRGMRNLEEINSKNQKVLLAGGKRWASPCSDRPRWGCVEQSPNSHRSRLERRSVLEKTHRSLQLICHGQIEKKGKLRRTTGSADGGLR